MHGIGRLALLQAGGNALLLGLGYYWLGIAESRGLTLAWSLAIACMWIVMACWLHGASFAWFAGKDSARPAFRTALRHLPAMFLFVAGVLFVYWLLGQLQDYAAKPAAQISPWLTLRFHKPIRPPAILKWVGVVFWIVRWMVLPVLFVPIFAGISVSGVRALSNWRRRLLYWAEAPLLLLVALWLPIQLIGWVPQVGGFGMEMTSFLLRLMVAYILFVGGCMVLEWVTASGKQVRV